jgi:hypothetical protein
MILPLEKKLLVVSVRLAMSTLTLRVRIARTNVVVGILKPTDANAETVE